MIKFIDSISSSNPQRYMDGKLVDFWDILNPKKVDNSLKKNQFVKNYPHY